MSLSGGGRARTLQRPRATQLAADPYFYLLPSEHQLVRLADKLSRSQRDGICLDCAGGGQVLGLRKADSRDRQALVGRFPRWVTEGLAACCLSRLDGWRGNVTARNLVATSDWFIAFSPRRPFPDKKRNRIGQGWRDIDNHNQEARCLQADSDTRKSMLAGPRSEEVGFAHDSALERAGFELPVPVRQAKLTRSCR
jgi:hypothetical protein